MLEKIGLPEKPSLRGSNWVVDASHCQGCSSQFTFLNRKHHCRRCGGLFCNSCTQQRMILRGQGDSPVRICDPCKKLEEASRFEMRYGYKNRAGKGSSKLAPNYEDKVLNEILGTEGGRSLSGRESENNMVTDIQRIMSGASSSNLSEETVTEIADGDIIARTSVDVDNHVANEMASTSPEELRQQALEEKKRHRVLKKEGKPEEALQAFKRGKKLEREADALEIALRKSRRKASVSSSLSGIQKTNGDVEESGRKNKLLKQTGKEGNDDLVAELKDLGWSDADLQDANKKPQKMSLEGELSKLLGDASQKSTLQSGTSGIDKSQVLAYKRRALMLKREGKHDEAKEELKRAKLLEKQLEEQEFLAGANDSDDELSAIIRSMDDDKDSGFSMDYSNDSGFEFEHLQRVADDPSFDGNFEVTDDDMKDPDIVSALKSFGWTEDAHRLDVDALPTVPKDWEAFKNEVVALKREAVSQKRLGNIEEAMGLLKKAKLLEKEVGELLPQSHSNIQNTTGPNPTQKTSTSQTAQKSSTSMMLDSTVNDVDNKPPQKSKLIIQKELIGLKKKALALRREGKLDEADEALEKGKVLEQQLEEMENASKPVAAKVTAGGKYSAPASKHKTVIDTSLLAEDGDETDVTEQDMQDPALLSLLKDLGWQDADAKSGHMPMRVSDQFDEQPSRASGSYLHKSSINLVQAPRTGSKAEIQRELLLIKRKALTLRREGKFEGAEEELRRSKVLEAQIAEMEAPQKQPLPDGTGEDLVKGKVNVAVKVNVDEKDIKTSSKHQDVAATSSHVEEGEEIDVTDQDMHDSALLSVLKDLGWKHEAAASGSTLTKASNQIHSQSAHTSASAVVPSGIPIQARTTKAEIQKELLGLKRKALTLRRQGKLEQAEEELKRAKVLEAQMTEMETSQEIGYDSNHKGCGNVDGSEEVTEAYAMLPSSTKPMALNKEAYVEKDVPDFDMKNQKAPEALLDFTMKASNRNKETLVTSAISTLETSQINEYKLESITKPGLPAEERPEHADSVPQASQFGNAMDLLTGSDWNYFHQPLERLPNESHSGIDTLPLSKTNFLQTSNSPEVVSKHKTSPGGLRNEETAVTVEKVQAHNVNPTLASNPEESCRQEMLACKRKAVVLKREGKLAEAREELRKLRLLEKSINEDDHHMDVNSSNKSRSTPVNTNSVPQSRAGKVVKPVSTRDRFKLQQECLAHKRQALKLRREGRMEESDAEFELAKAIEARLEDSSNQDSNSTNSVHKPEEMGDVVVEDFLDPQLLSALKAIGLQDVEQSPPKSEAKVNVSKSGHVNEEKAQLSEQIKAEKLQAYNLKQAGKKDEALNALRRAKQLEKKLNSLTS